METRIPLISAALLAAIVSQLSCTAYAGDNLTVSLDHLQLQSGERIVSFQIQAQGAGIVSLRAIPIGWAINVDNDASWTTTISGTVEVGAAALDPGAFKAFMVIEKADPDLKLPMKLSGEVVAANLATGSVERHIMLGPDQFTTDKAP